MLRGLREEEEEEEEAHFMCFWVGLISCGLWSGDGQGDGASDFGVGYFVPGG